MHPSAGKISDGQKLGSVKRHKSDANVMMLHAQKQGFCPFLFFVSGCQVLWKNFPNPICMFFF